GAVWSSCSPDFGVASVLDRFGQIAPRVLVAATGYFFGGKRFDIVPRLLEIQRGLPTVEQTIVVPYGAVEADRVPQSISWTEWLACGPNDTAHFEQLPFNHPLY